MPASYPQSSYGQPPYQSNPMYQSGSQQINPQQGYGATGYGTSGEQFGQQNPSIPPSQPKKSGVPAAIIIGLVVILLLCGGSGTFLVANGTVAHILNPSTPTPTPNATATVIASATAAFTKQGQDLLNVWNADLQAEQQSVTDLQKVNADLSNIQNSATIQQSDIDQLKNDALNAESSSSNASDQIKNVHVPADLSSFGIADANARWSKAFSEQADALQSLVDFTDDTTNQAAHDNFTHQIDSAQSDATAVGTTFQQAAQKLNVTLPSISLNS